MRISKARFPIAHLSLPNQLEVARAVVRQTQANGSLAADDAPLAALERETAALAGADAEIQQLRLALSAAIEARKKREFAFRKACQSFTAHVTSVAQGDEAAILRTGLVLQRSTRPPMTAEAIAAPVDVRGAPGDLPKQVRLRWRAVPRARAYLIERSDGPVDGFTQVGTATTRKILLVDQPTDRAYWYRVVALGRGGTGPFSTPHPVHPLADFANEAAWSGAGGSAPGAPGGLRARAAPVIVLAMPEKIDFEQVFALSPNSYMLLDRELRYVAANASYLRVTASRLEDLLGRHVFDLFPNDPGDPNNLPARMLRASLELVLAAGVPDALALLPYRVPTRRGAEIVIEDRFWSATHTPILDAEGVVAFILQHTVDVTELERLRRGEASAPAEHGGSLQAVGAGVLDRAEAVQAANLKLKGEHRELRALFEQAPGFMCLLQGPEHVFALLNAAFSRLVGRRELLGRTVRAGLPELAGQGFLELLDGVYASGEAHVGEGARVALQRIPGAALQEAFVDFIYQPVRGDDGAVTGIFVQGHDVTERRAAERERAAAQQVAEVFSSELVAQSHAVKLALEQATQRIGALEAELARRR